MADSKLTALTEDTTHSSDDMYYKVDDAGGTPVSRKISAANMVRIPSDELTLQQRRDNGFFTLVDGFDGSAIPAGYAWQGAPFSTPTVDFTTYPSMMALSSGGAMRSFLSTTSIPASTLLPVLYMGWALGASTSFAGLRMDDGSDNNYFEWCFAGDLKYTMRTRIGGGAVGTVQGSAFTMAMMYGLRTNRTGTKYSSWGANIYHVMPWQAGLFQTLQATSATTTAAWTPTRYGIVFDVAATALALFDALYTS